MWFFVYDERTGVTYSTVYVRCLWRKISITSNPLCLLCTKSGWTSFLTRPVCCESREVGYHLQPNLFTCMKIRRAWLRARSVSCVRTEHRYHFRVPSVTCVQTEDGCNFETGLCLVYEQNTGITSESPLWLVHEENAGITSSTVCVLCTNRA